MLTTGTSEGEVMLRCALMFAGLGNRIVPSIRVIDTSKLFPLCRGAVACRTLHTHNPARLVNGPSSVFLRLLMTCCCPRTDTGTMRTERRISSSTSSEEVEESLPKPTNSGGIQNLVKNLIPGCMSRTRSMTFIPAVADDGIIAFLMRSSCSRKSPACGCLPRLVAPCGCGCNGSDCRHRCERAQDEADLTAGLGG